MICPVCHKNKAEVEVERHFGNMSIKGVVCPNCVDAAKRLGASGFIYLFNQLPHKTCSRCGRSFNDICQTLMVGCPNCYKEFSDELKPLIDSLQGK